MTRITFHGNNGELGSYIVSDSHALNILKTIKSVDTFNFNGDTLVYHECSFVFPENRDCHCELRIFGEVIG